MIHSLRLTIQRSLDPDSQGTTIIERLWRRPDLPSREYFAELIEQTYHLIQLPWFPSRVWVEVETRTEIQTVECDRPVDEPGLVVLALWAEFARIGGGL